MKYRKSTFVLFGLLSLAASSARADLTSDLVGIEDQAATLRTALAAVDGPVAGMCGGLVGATQLSRDLVNEVTRVDEALAAPLTVDGATLDAVERLSLATVDLANEAARLTGDVSAQQTAAGGMDMATAISAVLQLSSDIGVMADRIGEMSDKILVMSDDIGAMADRILVTQQVQSDNLVVTQQSVLATQTNALALVSVVEDATYGLSFATLAADGEALATALSSTTLSPWNMATKLSAAATDVRALTQDVESLRAVLLGDTTQSTVASSATALTQLTDLSAMLAGLSTAVDGYVVAISGLQAITSSPTLLASLKSMLQLSADIGLMANRILEMADQILAMSGNIGLQADQLVLTQESASLSVASSQATVLAVQEWAVALIVARSL